MFGLSFTKSDVVRSMWGFLLPFVVVFTAGLTGIAKDLLTSCQTGCDVDATTSAALALAVGVGSSLLIGVKNLVLKDGTTLKG